MAGMFRAVGARRLVLIAWITLCAIWYVKQNVVDAIPTPGLSDFRYYYDAARHLLHGESPYLTSEYIYPPLLAWLLAPIAWLDYYTARWIWFVFSHACFLAAACLLWRRIGRDWLAASVIAFVWAGGWAAADTFPTGQPDAQLAFLIVVALVRTDWLQGVSVGAGFAVKLLPAILGLLAPLERSWRALIGLFASAALLTALPWLAVAFLTGPAKPANTDYLFGSPCVLSWSIPSIALRAFEPPGKDGKLPSDWVIGWDLPRLHLSGAQKVVSLSAGLATLAAGIAALLLRTRGRLSTVHVPIAGAALIALGMAASPIAWWHYQAMQYPGVAVLLCYALRRRQWRLLSAGLVCAAFLFPIPAGVLRYYYHQHERWPDSPAFMYFWTSVTPMASLALFGMLLSILKPRPWTRAQDERKFVAVVQA
jgi:hypothetical protein